MKKEEKAVCWGLERGGSGNDCLDVIGCMSGNKKRITGRCIDK